MNRQVKRWVAITAGWFFILLGIVGLFLPVLQGVLFILIGLVILSSEYVWAHHLLLKIRGRFPSLAHRIDQAKERVHHWRHKQSRQPE